MTDIREYVPAVFSEIKEFDAIFGAVNHELEKFERLSERAFLNTFEKTADDAGLRRMAQSMGLPSGGSIDSLRLAVSSALKERRPYTWKNLIAYLDGLLGSGNYTLSRSINTDGARDSVELRISLPDDGNLAPLRRSLDGMVPANMALNISVV